MDNKEKFKKIRMEDVYKATLKPAEDFQPLLLVLLPYKFTLLSNHHLYAIVKRFVLLPYKFTLLSNGENKMKKSEMVLLPYKFTLLSNFSSDILMHFDVLLPEVLQ